MKQPRLFVRGKTAVIVLLIAVLATVLIVFLTGLPSQRTVLANSFVSVSILALLFFSFVGIGLYRGLHIHDDLSHKLQWGFPKSSIVGDGVTMLETPASFDGGEGIAGILISIVIWIVMAILFILFLVLLEFVLWASLLALIGIVYWALIRALKLIFSKSIDCQGNLLKSIAYAGGYTTMYLGWIYGMLYVAMILS